MYLKAAPSKKAELVLSIFEEAMHKYGWASRARWDKGKVCHLWYACVVVIHGIPLQFETECQECVGVGECVGHFVSD